MKQCVTKVFVFSVCFVFLFGCNQKLKRLEPNFYKNLFTEEILNKSEFEKLINDLHTNLLDTNYLHTVSDTIEVKKYVDSVMSRAHINLHFYSQIINNDSIIQPFKYSIRIGNEYIVRVNSYEKIGMQIESQKFLTINGDSVRVGGKQDKPILINLWFVACGGCVAEIPALNRLQEKYADKVEFVAMTFERESDVLNFLKRKEFNFKHIANSSDFINKIGTSPYPENIFIDKNGYIRYIEGGLSSHEDLDLVIKHFESIIEDLLTD